MTAALPPDFADFARGLGVSLNDTQCAKLERYAELLADWNTRMNLTRVPLEETWRRHFLDSLVVAAGADFAGARTLCDLGTGAGLPGMVLKIAFPGLEVTLVDSVRKKLSFLDAVIEDLGLEGVRTLHGRAEDIGRDARHRERYDIVTARAVAEMRVLVELALPLLRKGGRAVFLKGADCTEELAAAGPAITKLGAQVVQSREILLHELKTTLLVLEKTAPTPPAFPRPPKRIAEKPL